MPGGIAGTGSAPAQPAGNPIADVLFGSTGPRGGHREGLVEAFGKSAIRSVGSTVGRTLMRGLLGTFMKTK